MTPMTFIVKINTITISSETATSGLRCKNMMSYKLSNILFKLKWTSGTMAQFSENDPFAALWLIGSVCEVVRTSCIVRYDLEPGGLETTKQKLSAIKQQLLSQWPNIFLIEMFFVCVVSEVCSTGSQVVKMTSLLQPTLWQVNTQEMHIKCWDITLKNKYITLAMN